MHNLIKKQLMKHQELFQTSPKMIIKMEFIKLKSYIMLLICGLYPFHYFTDVFILDFILSVLIVFVFMIALLQGRLFTIVSSVLMFTVAIIVSLQKQENLQGYMELLSANLPLLCLIIIIPLLSVPLKAEGYFKSVNYLIQSWTSDYKRIHASISSFIFLVAPILNLGTLNMVHDMVRDLNLNKRMMSSAYFVGFSTILSWSPFFASVAFVLYLVDVSSIDFMKVGLPFAIMELVMGNLIFLWISRKMVFQKQSSMDSLNPSVRREHLLNILKLLGMLMMIMAAIFMLERITHWPIMLVIVISSVVLPLLWSVVRRKWTELQLHFQEYRLNSLPAVSNEILLFISAGMFGASLKGTSISGDIREIFVYLASQSFMLLTLVIILIIVLPGSLGIHPIAIISLILMQVSPSDVDTRPEVLALICMLGWAITTIVSPIAPLNIIISSYLNKPFLTVGLKWNSVYLLGLFMVGTLYIYLIH